MRQGSGRNTHRASRTRRREVQHPLLLDVPDHRDDEAVRRVGRDPDVHLGREHDLRSLLVEVAVQRAEPHQAVHDRLHDEGHVGDVDAVRLADLLRARAGGDELGHVDLLDDGEVRRRLLRARHRLRRSCGGCRGTARASRSYSDGIGSTGRPRSSAEARGGASGTPGRCAAPLDGSPVVVASLHGRPRRRTARTPRRRPVPHDAAARGPFDPGEVDAQLARDAAGARHREHLAVVASWAPAQAATRAGAPGRWWTVSSPGGRARLDALTRKRTRRSVAAPPPEADCRWKITVADRHDGRPRVDEALGDRARSGRGDLDRRLVGHHLDDRAGAPRPRHRPSTSHCTISPSAMPSPMSGSLNSIVEPPPPDGLREPARGLRGSLTGAAPTGRPTSRRRHRRLRLAALEHEDRVAQRARRRLRRPAAW